MPIDPALNPFRSSWTHLPPTIDNPLQFREASNRANDEGFDQFTLPAPSVAKRQVIEIGTGSQTFNIICYWPASEGPHPVHLFVHGGGWTIGSAFSRDSETVSRYRCVNADCIVVSVDYRKAPEHPYPAAVHDLLATIDWVIGNSEALGALPGAITVGGQSSGANIAAAATLALRNDERTEVGYQILEVPVLDLTHGVPREEGDDLPLSMSDVRTFCATYVSAEEAARDTLASPLLAADLSGLPPAYIAVAEYDVLRPDGELYARRLLAAGVKAELYLGHGHVHMSPSMTRLLPSARAWRTATTRALILGNTGLLADRGQAGGVVAAI
ncbi:hypothetical protein GCM10027038_14740 [Arthrobacter bambusae]